MNWWRVYALFVTGYIILHITGSVIVANRVLRELTDGE